MQPHLEAAPKADFHYLDTLWFQISGTLCNLRCTHCFISCAPDNDTLRMMDTETVLLYLDKARKLGVKEIYFTGGEPFIHKDMLYLLERSSAWFPTSVLTNGMLIDDFKADRLGQIAQASPYSVEIRISLDDFEEAKNDSIRGNGTYRKVLSAYKRLSERNLLPILTVTEIRGYLWSQEQEVASHDRFVELLRSVGIERPRIKVIPVFEMGMLPERDSQKVTAEMMAGYDHSLLQCSSSRIVAQDGVYACPILVGEQQARLSNESLQEASQPCSLYHSACHTCYSTGMTCKNS